MTDSLMSVELCWKEDGLLLAHLSLLGHISGELGLEEVSDFISWEECPKSGVFWAPETLSLRAQRDRSHKLYKKLRKDGQIVLPRSNYKL